MPSGVPISRQWVYILKNGTMVFDWGDGLAQDLLSGDFLQFDRGDISHTIQDDELELLKRAARVERYDQERVYVYFMPEPPRNTIE